jgi:HPt (histidine-containing phosphotransfer) domain-containing protein
VTSRSAAPSTGPPAVPTLSKLRLEAIAREVSPEFLLELVDLFVADVERKLVALSQAVSNQQWERALSLSHALHGSAASLGVQRFGALAARLERQLERSELRAARASVVRLQEEFSHVKVVLRSGEGEHATALRALIPGFG